MIFPLSNADPFAIIGSSPRGISSAGRALEWHSRGQGFDPPILHLKKKVELGNRVRLFYVICFTDVFFRHGFHKPNFRSIGSI